MKIIKITLVVFIAELAAALYSGSLTMLSDAFHLLIHIFAPFIAYLSEFKFWGLSEQKIKNWTAGTNIFLFFLLATFISLEAWGRINQPPVLKIGFVFMAIAVIGLGANIYNAYLLHLIEDKECHQNIEPLFWHMVFDGIGSVIVIIGALVVYLTGAYVVDPILSLTLALLIVIGAIFMLWRLATGYEHNH